MWLLLPDTDHNSTLLFFRDSFAQVLSTQEVGQAKFYKYKYVSLVETWTVFLRLGSSVLPNKVICTEIIVFANVLVNGSGWCGHYAEMVINGKKTEDTYN